MPVHFIMPHRLAPGSIGAVSFRPITLEDEALLFTIYASTRAEEMAMIPHWPEDQKTGFLQQQFLAQHTYYQQVFPQAEYLIILHDQQPAGRLYLDRRPDALHIIDIALLPEYRNRGLGEGLLLGILQEAIQVAIPVDIHVERQNPALHLYQRLGFTMVDDSHPIYLLMEWNAAASPPLSS